MDIKTEIQSQDQKPQWNVSTVKSRLDTMLKRVGKLGDTANTIFTSRYFDQSRVEANALASKGGDKSPLSGAIITIKDLFDIKGETTLAGSVARRTEPIATRDAEVVQRLKAAGSIIIGKTNMTELAYSGVGLNPHFGTPENAVEQGCIPGGSTSGGAISVARNLCDIAIGSDTGGSLRIPAALNNLIGFKPTQSTVSRKGVVPLSPTLDSIGPIAKSVDACARAWQIMSHNNQHAEKTDTQALDLLVPTNFGFDDADDVVCRAFEDAVKLLEKSGHSVTQAYLPALEFYKSMPIWIFAAVESLSAHHSLVTERGGEICPRVLRRLKRGFEVSGLDYANLISERLELIGKIEDELEGRTLIMPTVPIVAPRIEAFGDNTFFDKTNLLLLRNPTLANVMDGCSISIPIPNRDHPVGFMLTKQSGYDHILLDEASEIERLFG